ncbi:MAG: SUMF1/EgtB/PvdO family nonheme iron enzyme, partial [Planctomycetia bacterium]
MLRGGSWNNQADNCRSSIRNHNQPDNRNNNIGFRVASTLQRTSEFAAPELADSLREFCRE